MQEKYNCILKSSLIQIGYKITPRTNKIALNSQVCAEARIYHDDAFKSARDSEGAVSVNICSSVEGWVLGWAALSLY